MAFSNVGRLAIFVASLFLMQYFFNLIYIDYIKELFLFSTISTSIYIYCSSILIRSRMHNTEEKFSLPVRGELLFHIISLFMVLSFVSFCVLGITENKSTGRLVILLGGGFLAMVWISLLGIVCFGSRKEQEKLSAQLAGATFTKYKQD